jgi:hypothetical protein
LLYRFYSYKLDDVGTLKKNLSQVFIVQDLHFKFLSRYFFPGILKLATHAILNSQ